MSAFLGAPGDREASRIEPREPPPARPDRDVRDEGAEDRPTLVEADLRPTSPGDSADRLEHALTGALRELPAGGLDARLKGRPGDEVLVAGDEPIAVVVEGELLERMDVGAERLDDDVGRAFDEPLRLGLEDRRVEDVEDPLDDEVLKRLRDDPNPPSAAEHRS